MIGHDIHLPMPQGFAPPSPPATAPSPATRVARTPTPLSQPAIPSHLTEEITAELPSRRRAPQGQGRSRLARFLGRWTRSGRFVSDSRSPDEASDAPIDIPRDPLARNVALVLVVALTTFLLTLFGVKARQHLANKPSPPVTPAAAPAATATPNLPAQGR